MKRYNEDSNEIFEILLREPLKQKMQKEADELINYSTEYTFTEDFKKKVNRISKGINREERRKQAAKITIRAFLSVTSVFGVVYCLLLFSLRFMLR